MRMRPVPIKVWNDSVLEYRDTTMPMPYRVADLLTLSDGMAGSRVLAFHGRGAIGSHAKVSVCVGQVCIGRVNVDADTGAILGAWLANASFGFREVSYGHWRRAIRRQLAWANEQESDA